MCRACSLVVRRENLGGGALSRWRFPVLSLFLFMFSSAFFFFPVAQAPDCAVRGRAQSPLIRTAPARRAAGASIHLPARPVLGAGLRVFLRGGAARTSDHPRRRGDRAGGGATASTWGPYHFRPHVQLHRLPHTPRDSALLSAHASSDLIPREQIGRGQPLR